MSILKKPATQITPDELETLEKPLGVKGRPYPMRDTAIVKTDKGNLVLQQRLGVLEAEDINDALILYSERPYDEVFGTAMRDMPIPGMLNLFFDAIRLRAPDSKRKIHYMKGKAGTGKTFLGEMIGRMRSDKKPIVIDCGGKDLNELVFETVLDFGNNKSFFDEFNKRIDAYNHADPADRHKIFHQQSINTLKAHLGEAFDQDKNGKIAIDWSRTNQCLKDKDGDYLSSLETVKIVNDGLLSVARKEGFADLAGNALGMATQYGALVRAIEEGREIILDEFNRAKKGTSASLHGVLQLLAGEREEVTVENTLKEKGDLTSQSYTFRRADFPIGFFCTLTGNDSEDGHDVEELPESLNSRIIPQPVPVATEEDWQHRWCQILTGLPVSTLYRAGQKQWDANPDAFRSQLMKWRKVGLPEGTQIPDFQLKRLQNWEDTLAATEKLARLCYGWSQIVDPDSPLHRSGNLANLLDEIDDNYKKEVSIDFRKISYFIEEALKLRPKVKAVESSGGFDLSDDYSKPPRLGERKAPEDPALNFGDRLSQALINHISKTTSEKGKMGLYLKVMQHAADCGLNDPKLMEGRQTSSRYIADLLNYNPYRSPVASIRAEVVRDLLCNRLREVYPDIKAGNDEIMSLPMVQEALAELEEEYPFAEQELQALTVFNEDPETIYSEPLVHVKAWDSVRQAANDEGQAPKASELLAKKALLLALTAPVMRDRNMEALWTKVFTSSGLIPEKVIEKNEPLAMAEGESKTDLAVTTVMVADDSRKKATAKALHLIWNDKSHNLVVVGEGTLASDLQQAFRLSGSLYIDKKDKDALARAEAAVKDITGGDQKHESQLKTAFLMRAGTDDRAKERESSLAQLLVSKDTKPYLPLYLTSQPAAPAA